MLTAVGQGALGIETRIDDQRTNFLVEFLNHWPTRHATEAERAVLRKLGGGCAVPIAAFGRVTQEINDGKSDDKLVLDALVCDIDGKQMIRKQATGPLSKAEEIGVQLAQELIDSGARDLLPRIGDQTYSFVQSPPVREQIEVAAAPASVSKSEEREFGSPRPLTGCRVIVTRSIKQSSELSHTLSSLGAEVVACPTIEIREPSSWDQMDNALQHLSWYDWLAFTSTNGVEYFLRRLDELGHGRAELMSHRVCAVGRKTAEKLRNEKITVDLMPERFTADALVEEFLKQFGVRNRLRGARMLLPASQMTRDVIRPALAKVGVHVDVVEAYQTIMPQLSRAEINLLIRDPKAHYIIFTSPSTVANLSALLESDNLSPFLENIRVACIGPITAEAARSHGLKTHIQPEEHTGKAIVRALVAEFLKR
jgi:uroporphyrinogen-III synthase